MGRKAGEKQTIHAQLSYPNKDPALVVEFSFPAECDFDMESPLASKRFSDIRTWPQMREVWNAIGSFTTFWQAGTKLKALTFIAGNNYELPILWHQFQGGTVYKDWVATFDRTSAPVLNGEENAVTFSLLQTQSDLEKLKQLLQLDDGKIPPTLSDMKLKFVVGDGRGYNFSPTLGLDPVLGRKTKFGEAFPNLEKLPAQYQIEDPGALPTLLEKTVTQQQKGELEIFGAKVPSDLIALLGLPILAILLFQFSAVGFYVRSHIERIGEEEAAEWSFLLQGWPFLIMSLVTSFVCPVADYTFNINARGLYFMVKHAAPAIPDGGAILFTGSTAGSKGGPGMSVYSASKAAVRSLARTFAAELAPRNIRVNVISPGPIETPIFGKVGLSQEQLDGWLESSKQRIPLGRIGQPEEVAVTALFLAADASFTTGAEIFVGGGMVDVFWHIKCRIERCHQFR